MSFLRPVLHVASPLRAAFHPHLRHTSTYARGTPAYKTFWHTRFVVTTAGVLLLSFASGVVAIKSILPGLGPIDIGPLHLHGSEEDLASTMATAAEISKHPSYRALADSPDWTELPDHYLALSPEARRTKLTSGTLWGHRKMSANKTFLHVSGKETRTVLALGTALCGHPNVIHGGVLATVLDEALGRLAIRQFGEGRQGVTAKLVVNYRAPAHAVDSMFNPDGVVVLTAKVVEVVANRKSLVRGEIRDKDGKLLVESEALFVVPRGWTPRPLAHH